MRHAPSTMSTMCGTPVQLAMCPLDEAIRLTYALKAPTLVLPNLIPLGKVKGWIRSGVEIGKVFMGPAYI